MSKKYVPLKYLQYNSCEHKIIVLNLNNADNICATENMSNEILKIFISKAHTEIR